MVRILGRQHLVGNCLPRLGAEHIVDTQRIEESAVGMRIARPALAEGVVQTRGHPAVDIRHGRIVKIAADQAPPTRSADLGRDTVHLCGTQFAVRTQAAHDTAELHLAGRIRKEAPRGDVFVVVGIDRRGVQVVVEHAQRILIDKQIGPRRRMGRQHRGTAQNPVFAQDNQPRILGNLGISGIPGFIKPGDIIAVEQQPEGVGTAGQPAVELLQADNIGVLFADKVHDTLHAAFAVRTVKTAHVVGHHLDRSPVGDDLLVAAPDLGPPEQRNPAEAQDYQHEHDPGLNPPPADNPIEHQNNRGNINGRSRKAQNRQEPDTSRIDIRNLVGNRHHRRHRYGKQRDEPIEQVQEEAPPRPHRRALAVLAVIRRPFHRLKPD